MLLMIQSSLSHFCFHQIIYLPSCFYYYPLQVEEMLSLSKERVDLAKALIRASEKPKKVPKGDKAGKDETAGAEAGEAATA